MASYYECPRCGRTVDETLTANWVPLNKCNGCGAKYCHGPNCADGEDICPECGSDSYFQVGEIYAQ
jgi:hypothetical protein